LDWVCGEKLRTCISSISVDEKLSWELLCEMECAASSVSMVSQRSSGRNECEVGLQVRAVC